MTFVDFRILRVQIYRKQWGAWP